MTGRPEPLFDLEAIEATARRAASAAQLDLPAAALCAGLAGAGRDRERDAVQAALSRRALATAVRVVTDAEAAFFDAFGDGPGLLLIAGTGSVAWGRSEDGREARVGGWGGLLGDEGSGYDIGLRALRSVARAVDGRGGKTELQERLLAQLQVGEPQALIAWAAGAGKTEIAALAPIVCELAAAGDSAAVAIVETAVASLQSHVAALLAGLGPWSAPSTLALAGSLIAPGGPQRAPLLAAVAQYECAPTEARVDAARGAARLVLTDLVRETR